jgi:hypothetical protein
LLAVLDHPNIIKLYETFQDKSKLCALPVLSRNHPATQRVEAAIVGSIRKASVGRATVLRASCAVLVTHRRCGRHMIIVEMLVYSRGTHGVLEDGQGVL